MSVQHGEHPVLLGGIEILPDHLEDNAESWKRGFRSVHGILDHFPQAFFGLSVNLVYNSLAQINGDWHIGLLKFVSIRSLGRHCKTGFGSVGFGL